MRETFDVQTSFFSFLRVFCGQEMSKKWFLRIFPNFIHQRYIPVNLAFLSSMSLKTLWPTPLLKALCVELYKTISKLNPNFISDVFKLRFTNRPVREKYQMNMIIIKFNQVSYGKKSFRTLVLNFGTVCHILINLQKI